VTEHPILRTANLSKSFGSVSVLSSIDFHVDPNESLGLIGDNGAGKSTLMKILAGVYAPSGGEIFFNGAPVTFKNPQDARAAGIEIIYQDWPYVMILMLLQISSSVGNLRKILVLLVCLIVTA